MARAGGGAAAASAILRHRRRDGQPTKDEPTNRGKQRQMPLSPAGDSGRRPAPFLLYWPTGRNDSSRNK
jgi:hypothetical protein